MHQPLHPREIIEMLRERRGFTSVRALAVAAGVNQPSLSRYLGGKAETLELETFAALAKVLEVTVSELIGEVPLNQPGNARLRELAKAAERLPEHEQNALLAAAKAMEAATKGKGH